MKKGKIMAILTGALNFVAILLWVVSFLFLIIVDRMLLTNTGSSGGTASEQLGEGLGKAFGLVFMIIGFAFLIPSIVVALVGGIGQCALGGAKARASIGFAIPAILAHIWAVLDFGFISFLSLDLGENRILPSLAYILPLVLSVFIIVFTIVALAIRPKTIKKEITLETLAETIEEVDNKVEEIQEEIAE